ncbi:MAG: DUF1003 domain-containing protein [Candidatus Buchananbacteria bacterium]|nr:DUF1003 domain-containing protein [Candidatus Buchananbacteria bacterium]
MVQKNKILKVGKKSKKDLIYKCSRCGNLQAMIEGEVASPCEICIEKGNKQDWLETNKHILTLTKNIRKEIESNETLTDKISDAITDFCGSMNFIYIHIVWFAGWLIYNLSIENPFDPFPFGLLTLIVSLEAILLATFILISQNRQSEVQDQRAELDYQIDLKSEKNTAEILTLLAKTYNLVKKNNKK